MTGIHNIKPDAPSDAVFTTQCEFASMGTAEVNESAVGSSVIRYWLDKSTNRFSTIIGHFFKSAFDRESIG
jgi:hypothetical protein